MKWIGQHIYDLIARFRNDIYLENISSGTIASGGNLGLDSNNKIVKQDDAGITDLHGAGVDGSNNQLLTDDGDGTVTSEANLTFDGSTLSIEADANTTQHALFIDMNSTTSGQAINVDIDHSNTGSTSVIGQQINLAKSGVTGDGASAAQYGFALTQSDLATNHANSTVVQQGIRSTVSSASTSGTNTNTALYLTSTGATTNLGIDVKTTDTTTALNGAGFINRSSVSDSSYFLINTQARGATEIATADHTGSSGGSVTFNTDGGMYFNAQGETQFYFSDIDETDDGFSIQIGTNGKTTLSAFRGSSGINGEDDEKIYIASKGVEIDNPSDSGNTALRIDNDDIDEIALQIDAQNRSADVLHIDATDVDTGNIIFIDSHSLTTGSAITLDVDDSLTASATKSLIHVDYDKSGVTASSQTSATTALEISMHDAANNNALGTVNNKGVDVTIDAASINGIIWQTGYSATLTDGDLDKAVGYYSNVEDGGVDFKAVSSANTLDYFSIATTANGATTLTTFDQDAAVAHFEVAADGDITLDAAGNIALESDGGTLTSDAGITTISNASSGKPALTLESRNTTKTTSSELKFLKDAADVEDAEQLGKISFYGDNDAGTPEVIQYGAVIGTVADMTDGQEAGELKFKVAEYDGTLTTGLRIDGDTDANGEIDVTIGAGAASVTTVAGTLTMGSTATLNNTGEIQVASQPNITTLAGLTSLGAAGATTDIAAGDLTMYNAVNDGNPTVRIGSSATNNFEIKPVYNSGAQTIDSVDFTTYTTSSSSNDGRYRFFVDEVELARILDGSMFVNGSFNAKGDGAYLQTKSETTSSATEGGKLRLICDDGAAMGNDHRLGVVQFEGAEDASSNFTIGAQIEAFCDAAWSASENGARMVFSTTDGNASTSTVLTLDSNKLATFAGDLTVNGDSVTFESTNSEDPLFIIKNTTNDTNGSILRFVKDKGAAGADGDVIGNIEFYGDDTGQNQTRFGLIRGLVKVAADGSEGGRILLAIATHDGEMRTGIDIMDGDAEDEIDVTIGKEATSLTTIAGDATVTSKLTAKTRKFEVSSATDGDYGGDVVYFGGTTSMTIGKIYHYKSDGTWELANADAVATSDGLLGVALGAASDTNGMLLRGMVTLDHDPGAIGDVLYVQSDNAGTPGNATATAPSASGDCVRIIGYQVSHASNGNIWFNPDNTFVEVA